MVAADAFLEYGKSGDYWYGTPRVTEFHVQHTAERPRHSRSSTVKKALDETQKHVRVGKSIGGAKTHNGKAIAEHSVTELLATVDPDHPELAETRRQVKKAIWSVTVPVTTRPPREGEVDRQDYHFVSRAKFFELLSANRFIEHGARKGYLYGTLAPTAADLERAKRASTAPGGAQRASMGGALAGADEVPELTLADFDKLLDGEVTASGLDGGMTVSQFFHHVEEDHEEHGELRDRIKKQILDMTVPYTTRPMRAGDVEGVS